MFRNNYDGDVTTFSPQGRIHQVEYAMEAVKQGSATVGLKSKTHAVLLSFNRCNPLAGHQEKIIEIDDHVGISIAGLTADARLLSKFMRSECYNSKYNYDAPMPLSRLVDLVSKKCQVKTQRYGMRPYGVGMLLAGYDGKGCHIFQTCPSANFFECKAMAIGARSQSAKTYLERHIDEFTDASLEELVAHGLKALRDTLPAEVALSTDNCSIGIVGKDVKFRIYNKEDVKQYLQLVEVPEAEVVPMEN